MRSVLILGLLAATPAFSQVVQSSEEHSFRVVKVVEGLEQPWSLAFLPDGRMLVTEKAGRLRVIDAGQARAAAGRRAAAGHGARAGRPARRGAASRVSRRTSLVYSRICRARRATAWAPSSRAARLDGHRLEDVQVLFRQSPKGRRRAAFRRAHRVRPRKAMSISRSAIAARCERAQQPGRPRGLGDPPARRRPRAEGQSVRRPHGLEAREVHARQPQHAGRGAAPADRRAVDARARAAGRRRSQHHPRRRNYGWPVDHLRRQLRHRHEDRRRHAKPGIDASAALLGAFDRAFGHGLLHGERFPSWRATSSSARCKTRCSCACELDGEKVVKEERLLKSVARPHPRRARRPRRLHLSAHRRPTACSPASSPAVNGVHATSDHLPGCPTRSRKSTGASRRMRAIRCSSRWCRRRRRSSGRAKSRSCRRSCRCGACPSR